MRLLFLSTLLLSCLSVSASWNIHYWTQAEVDSLIPHLPHKVGTVWHQKWTDDGSNIPVTNYDDVHAEPFISVAFLDTEYVNETPVEWTDDLTKPWVTLGTVRVLGAKWTTPIFHYKPKGELLTRMRNASQGFIRVKGAKTYWWINQEGELIQ